MVWERKRRENRLDEKWKKFRMFLIEIPTVHINGEEPWKRCVPSKALTCSWPGDRETPPLRWAPHFLLFSLPLPGSFKACAQVLTLLWESLIRKDLKYIHAKVKITKVSFKSYLSGRLYLLKKNHRNNHNPSCSSTALWSPTPPPRVWQHWSVSFVNC